MKFMEQKTIMTIDDKVLEVEKFLPMVYHQDYFAVAQGRLYVKRGQKYQPVERTYIPKEN